MISCSAPARAAEVVIDFSGVNPGNTYTQGAAVASYLAGFGVTTPNFLTVLDTPSYANYIASPTKNILTGGDGRNPTVMTLNFAEPVSNFRFTRAGIRGENSPSGTIAGDWTATAYNASNAVVGSVGEALTSFYGSRSTQLFTIGGSGITKVVFNGYDHGYAGINTPHITNVTFTTADTVGNTLSVSRTGSGSGTVTSAPSGISCGSTCSAAFTAGSSVALTATPADGSRFAGWSGACSGAGSCNVTMSSAQSVGAAFEVKTATTTTLASSVNPSTPGQSVTFTATVAGSGGTPSGTVTVKEGGTTVCGPLTLSAGQAQCAVSSLSTGAHSLVAEYSGDAVFQASASSVLQQNVGTTTQTLTVSRSGNGTGTVTSSPSGIACGSTCSATFSTGSSVTLTASAAAGSRFAGWSGACSGTGSCAVTLSGDRSVTAAFEQTTEVVIDFSGVNPGNTYTQGAAVASYLAGFGVTTPNFLTVLDTPSYANYIASPTKNILTGGDGRNPTVMTLNFAEPVSNFRFTRAGIRGENSPSGTIAGDWTATAYNASNAVVGSVGEALTSFYGSRASQVFTINASGITKVVFSGYDHGYAGINTPHITNVTFNRAAVAGNTLSVGLTGTGTGTVTSSPAGISCGVTCSAAFTAGSSVTLTEAAAAGSRFTGWSGACSGTAACIVSMTGDLSVNASFTLKTATTTTLASSLNPSAPGQGVTFTATVAGSGGTPTGTVTVKEGGTTLCGPLALSAGQAQCSLASLGSGTHGLTAEYAGDATYQPSVSGVLTQTVTTSSASTGAAIATSATHSLAVDAQGRVFAWGSDHRGQLGQGRSVTRATPVQVGGLPLVSAVAMARHVLALDSLLQVWGWGDNSCGQLGPREGGSTTRPARVAGARNMTAVAAGLCFSLALKTDGTVWAWGAVPGYSGTHFRQIPGLANIIDIAAGSRHGLALSATGVVYAFGDNAAGQLGLGSASAAQQVVQVPGLSQVARIAAGDTTSMAMRSDNSLEFWGTHQDGTLVAAPRALAGLGGTAVAFSVTGNRPYAGRVDGTVLGYRAASNDWLGEFPGFASIEKLAAGNADFVLGINNSGQLSASGTNAGGQLGLGHANAQAGVVPVPGFASTRMVRTGALDGSVVALRNDGTVWFWGADTAGESGDGAQIGSSLPRQVQLAVQARMVAAGDGFSAALDASGAVLGWGDNSSGALGATRVSRSVPAPVAGTGVVAAIAAGPRVLAFLRSDGTVAYSGVLPPLASVTEPTAIPGFTGITAIAVGESNVYGLTGDGRVLAVGENTQGQLGNGSLASSAAPVQATVITGTATRISAARHRAGAVMSDGRVYAWGAGPLGNGAASGSITPALVAGLGNAVDLSIGDKGALAKRSDGSLVAWGDMGLADAGASPLSPYSVSFPSPVGSLQAGRGNELGFIVANTGLAWGFGRYGTLASTSASIGDGTYVRRERPAVLLAPGGSGNIDTNDWFLDLDPSTAESIPAAHRPRMLGESRLFAGGQSLSVGATIRYKASDFDRPVGNYVFGLVAPAFFDVVKSAAGVPNKAGLAELARKNGGYIPVMLTANGWTTLSGQPVAFSQGVASAAGGAASILDGTPIAGLSGSRFCIGYGERSDVMLNAGTLVEVLQLEGAAAVASGQNCVIPGVYVDGPPGSRAGTPVTFKALVVGPNPTGTVQFRDDAENLLGPIAIASANPAVSTAAITVSTLSPGVTHPIGAIYSGDSQNAAAAAAFPLRHAVESIAPGQSRTTLEGPASSLQGDAVAFVATVIGNGPTGHVQFRKFNENLGSPVPLVGGIATLRVSNLEIGVPRRITAHYSGDGANAPSISNEVGHSVALSINSAVTLTSSPPSSTAGATVRLTATVTGASPTGGITFRDGPAVIATVQLSGGTAVYDAVFHAGVHVLKADYSGDDYNAATSSEPIFQEVAFAPGLASQAITFAALPNRTYGDAAFTISATASSTLLVAFSSASPAVCTVAGNTVTLLSAGTCTIDANQSGNAYYSAAPQVSRSFTVAKASQAITFGALPDRNLDAPPFAVSASASSGLPVAFASSTLPTCTVSGATVTLVAAGTCTISASQAGNANYQAALPVAQSFSIGAAPAPRLAASPSTIDFQGQSMGTTSPPRTITVTNSGNATLTISAIGVSNPQFAQTNNCGTVAAGAGCIITVTFSPAAVSGGLNATTPVSGAVTIAHNGSGPNSVALSGSGEKSLVSHYYQAILNRPSDAAGKAFWEAEAVRLTGEGASVNEVWFVMANYFLNSAEYVGRGKTDAQFLGDVYATFFNRPPDGGGMGFWQGQMNAGLSREGVIFWFMFSNEFRAFTQAIFGSVAGRPEIDMVMDLFRGILNRFPETAALDAYAGSLRAAQCQAAEQRAGAVYNTVNEMSYYFLFGSAEYPNRARSNRQFVSDMYNAFLRRGGTDEEMDFWINQLDSGAKDRNEMRAAFIATPEFAARVQAVAAAGCLR